MERYPQHDPQHGSSIRVMIVPQAPYAFGGGGIEIQQDQTIEALERRGLHVTRYSPWMESVDADVVHVFGSEYANADLVARLRKAGIPVVVTSMFMPSHPLWTYRAWAGVGRFINATTARLRQSILQSAGHIITISQRERQELQQAFGPLDVPMEALANGIESRFFHATKQAFVEKFGLDNIILCVGSIEPRKNQLLTAQALSGGEHDVVFIGPAAYHGGEATNAYVEEFQRYVQTNERIHWLGALPHHDPVLASAYAAARVHVLASTIEAQGLVSMEATAAGAWAVVSDLPQLRELFTSHVEWCDPTNADSIRQAVDRAVGHPRHDWTLQSAPHWLLSWDHIAERLERIYRSLLVTTEMRQR